MAEEHENYEGFNELDELFNQQPVVDNQEVLNEDIINTPDSTVKDVDAVQMQTTKHSLPGCSYVAQPKAQKQPLVKTVTQEPKRLNTDDIPVNEPKKARMTKKLIQLVDGHCPICGLVMKTNSFWGHCTNLHNEFIVSAQDVIYDYHQVEQFLFNFLGRTNFAHGTLVEMILFAEKYGYKSEGLAKLDYYVTSFYSGMDVRNASPIIESELNGTAFIDAKNSLGYESAFFCATKANMLSSTYGMGVVIVKNLNDFGCVQFYLDFIIEQGFVGLIISNNMVFIGDDQIYYNGSFEDNILFKCFIMALLGFSSFGEAKHLFMAKNKLTESSNLIHEFVDKLKLNTIEKNFEMRKNIYDMKCAELNGGLLLSKEIVDKMNAIALAKKIPPFPTGKNLLFDNK